MPKLELETINPSGYWKDFNLVKQHLKIIVKNHFCRSTKILSRSCCRPKPKGFNEIEFWFLEVILAICLSFDASHNPIKIIARQAGLDALYGETEYLIFNPYYRPVVVMGR